MTATDDRFPELWQFLGGYFHEDFDTYGSDWPEVVDCYVRETSADRRRAAVDEIDSLVAEEEDPAGIAHVLDRLGVAFLPAPLSNLEWLQAIRDRIAESLAG